MSDVTLSVRHLRKTIGRKEIIKGLNFELKKGEVFGFLRSKRSRKNNNHPDADRTDKTDRWDDFHLWL